MVVPRSDVGLRVRIPELPVCEGGPPRWAVPRHRGQIVGIRCAGTDLSSRGGCWGVGDAADVELSRSEVRRPSAAVARRAAWMRPMRMAASEPSRTPVASRDPLDPPHRRSPEQETSGLRSSRGAAPSLRQPVTEWCPPDVAMSTCVHPPTVTRSGCVRARVVSGAARRNGGTGFTDSRLRRLPDPLGGRQRSPTPTVRRPGASAPTSRARGRGGASPRTCQRSSAPTSVARSAGGPAGFVSPGGCRSERPPGSRLTFSSAATSATVTYSTDWRPVTPATVSGIPSLARTTRRR